MYTLGRKACAGSAPKAAQSAPILRVPRLGPRLRTGPTTTPSLDAESPSTSTATKAARSVAAAAPIVAGTLSTLPNGVVYAVTASCIYTAVVFLAMLLGPSVSAVRRSVQSYWVFAPLAIVYALLLAYSWSPDTLSIILPGSLAEGFTGGFNPQFFPKLDGIQTLFSRPATTASWVLHILAINLFLGRSIYLDGAAKGVPTALSLLVASVFGPLGLLLHWIMAAAFGGRKAETVLQNGSGGRIIILPYDK